MRIAILIVALSCGLVFSASAQLMMRGVGSGGSGSGAALTPCNAGQLDFSDATGCNLTLLMVGL